MDTPSEGDGTFSKMGMKVDFLQNCGLSERGLRGEMVSEVWGVVGENVSQLRIEYRDRGRLKESERSRWVKF